ncbi:LysM peptidoglycan-binding domain-containing protein [Winogradskyella sp. A2]|uniref:LysM peptidoglycan-binding domain-containing protein n=1 Tax=Winogradskyella sp. A2 TaxID=3366944 RepID=UPI00398C3A0A
MQKSCKLHLVLSFLMLNAIFLYGQDVKYKDVVLDGKPAKLNVETGEIILVKEKSSETSKKVVIKIKDSITQGEDFPENYHIVEQGETLLDISEKYSISINVLKEANGLETTLVRAGEKIWVRNLDKKNPLAIKSVSKSIHNFNSDFHTVKKGETLYSIARRYEIELATLKEENELTSSIINVGQRLKIRNFDLSKDINSTNVWVVKEGDSLYTIAFKTGTTVSKLKRINGLQSDIIKVGQKLVLK